MKSKTVYNVKLILESY